MGEYGVRLSEVDADRFGVPQVLDCDFNTLTLGEAEAIEELTGLSIDEAVQVLEAAAWHSQRDENGKPVDGPLVRDYRALRLPVWFGLYRAGVRVPYAELDFRLAGVAVVFTKEPAPESEQAAPGKDPSTPQSSNGDESEASGTSGKTSPRRSRTSSASARGRSNG